MSLILQFAQGKSGIIDKVRILPIGVLFEEYENDMISQKSSNFK